MRPDVPVRLIAGPGGRRLERVALAAAARAVCRFDHAEMADDCPDCRRVSRKEHPDVLVAAPERSRRVNTPWFEEGSSSKETTIPTALVRVIAGEATRLPYEAKLRAIVLLDVDRTEPAAYSALLKILEEPPWKTRFLLTATRPRLLPPTILSRVALHALPGLRRDETQAALRERGVSEGEAEARAAFVPDDPEAALELDLPTARARRDALLEALSGVYLGESVAWALVLSGLLTEETGEVAERLALVALLLRDATAATVDPAGRCVVHRERFRDLSALGAVPASELLAGAEKALLAAAELADARFNVRLAADAFALSLVKDSSVNAGG